MKRVVALILGLLVLAGPGNAAEDQVHVVPGSNVNLVARDAAIPVNILNPTDQDVSVILHGKTTSFRLEVLETTEVIVPAGSSSIGELKVRAIANGPVEIKVWLTIDGETVGDEVAIAVNVAYDVELFLLVSFGVLVVVLLVLGIIRTAMKFARRGK
ncbi:MAG: DUF6049 family protein [Aquiluna sp.]|nr:DUF6049 family protein [Aquiluna sp.]MCF8545711.1 DUF6049 family protein [Aquiluna sp.]